jgi:2-polyprenyl-3-methyl-5-hydroxy-6-metoxy-1,4-benzoquinol methylase
MEFRRYKNTKTRFKPLLPHIRGKVLDVCCVGMGSNDIMGGYDFMHGKLKRFKPNITLYGIDIDKEGVENMNKTGFNVFHQDVQEPFNLKMKFDTIICEEGIEHLDNLKQFLKNVHNHLENDGLFLLTTPNIIGLVNFLGVLIHSQPRKNPYHTHYHIRDSILYLLKSNGFEILNVDWFSPTNLKSTNFNARVTSWLTAILPHKWGKHIWVVARKKGTRKGYKGREFQNIPWAFKKPRDYKSGN